MVAFGHLPLQDGETVTVYTHLRNVGPHTGTFCGWLFERGQWCCDVKEDHWPVYFDIDIRDILRIDRQDQPYLPSLISSDLAPQGLVYEGTKHPCLVGSQLTQSGQSD